MKRSIVIMMKSCQNCDALLPHELIVIFCPQCGYQRINLETELAKKGDKIMHRVDITVQILLAFIPFVNFIAAFRIRKLQTYIGYGFIAGLLTLGVAFIVASRVISCFYCETPFTNSFLIIWWLMSSSIMIYFIIKWTKEFNKSRALIEKFSDQDDSVIANPNLSRTEVITRSQDQTHEEEDTMLSGTANKTIVDDFIHIVKIIRKQIILFSMRLPDNSHLKRKKL